MCLMMQDEVQDEVQAVVQGNYLIISAKCNRCKEVQLL